jgi:membrane protease YdiL (CAAX protease family)
MNEGMSSYIKGTRKPKSGYRLGDITIAGHKIKPELAVTVLLSALYILFLLGSTLESGTDALVLAVFSFIIFVAFAYLVRSGGLVGLRPFMLLIDAFLALSALTLIRCLAIYFIIIDLSGLHGPALIVAVNAIISIVLIGCLLYFEKGKLKEMYVGLGSKGSMAIGAAVFAVCIVVGIAGLYFLTTVDTNKLLLILATALTFSIIGAAYEELWFRGLLLSRLIPLIGENKANISQALVFGVFEAVTVYAVTTQYIYLPVAFIVGSVLGYYWGKITTSENSIVSAALFHAGFYMLISIPILVNIK